MELGLISEVHVHKNAYSTQCIIWRWRCLLRVHKRYVYMRNVVRLTRNYAVKYTMMVNPIKWTGGGGGGGKKYLFCGPGFRGFWGKKKKSF